MPLITGGSFLEHLCELGIIPRTSKRIVIEAAVDSAVTIYVEQYGDKRLLSVRPDTLCGATIVLEEVSGATE